MAPSAWMALSKDNSRIEQVLFQTRAFYVGKFEITWYPQLQKSSKAFDLMCEMENFSSSVTPAAGLIAIGGFDMGSLILSRVLRPCIPLLISQHPQLYYILAELSPDTSETQFGRLRSQVEHFAAGVSHAFIGAIHLIKRLLRVYFSPNQCPYLRELILREIHDLHGRLFTSIIPNDRSALLPPPGSLTTGAS